MNMLRLHSTDVSWGVGWCWEQGCEAPSRRGMEVYSEVAQHGRPEVLRVGAGDLLQQREIPLRIAGALLLPPGRTLRARTWHC